MGEDKAIKNNNFIGIRIMSFKVKIITFLKALALGANFPKPFDSMSKKSKLKCNIKTMTVTKPLIVALTYSI